MAKNPAVTYHPTNPRRSSRHLERVGLVVCCRDKHHGWWRAKDIYKSAPFKERRLFAERCYNRWFILSAKHNLLDPEKVIRWYNLAMDNLTPAQRREWRQVVASQIRERFPDPRKVVFYFHAGLHYTVSLARLLSEHHYKFKRPLRGMSQNRQQRWHREMNARGACP